MSGSKFEYIVANDLRAALDSDYAEIIRGFEQSNWKSVQVLAGSVVEALLVDYLVSISSATRVAKDPLRMDLSELIAVCVAEKAISPRTSDLCSVVRSFRNLIHPGRLLRLSEPMPDARSALIARSLVEIIADEMAEIRRASQGLTAEQIVSKIRRDSSSLAILPHLLQEVSVHQKERLLTDLLPAEYELEFRAFDSDAAGDYLARLSSAYRTVLESSAPASKTRAAEEFVRVLKQDDGDRVERYLNAFFRPADLGTLQPDQAGLVIEHLLARLNTVHSDQTIEWNRSLCRYLLPKQAGVWVDSYVRTYVQTPARMGKLCSDEIQACGFEAGEEFIDAVLKRLAEWKRHTERNGKPEVLVWINSTIEGLEFIRTPF